MMPGQDRSVTYMIYCVNISESIQHIYSTYSLQYKTAFKRHIQLNLAIQGELAHDCNIIIFEIILISHTPNILMNL